MKEEPKLNKIASEPPAVCDVTVTTACDHNYVWGAMLLGISLRYHRMDCPFHILGFDLSEEDIRTLQSIPNTKVFPTKKQDSRNVCIQKPASLATAETETIVWMDADCIVSGDITSLFICPEDKMQIRQREAKENSSVFRNFYSRTDKFGYIPKRVLEIWQRDVDDLKEPQIETAYQTNCFVLNSKHLPFIQLWHQQMLKVIPPEVKGVYNKDSIAYSMTDESVVNSLFAFSSQAPQRTEYLMDKYPLPSCIHFGLSPKPWQHWTLQALPFYKMVQELINWAKDNDILLPPLTPALWPENKWKEYLKAIIRDSARALRYWLSTLLRRIHRKVF